MTHRGGADREAAARAISDFLRALGHAPDGELAETGRRVADAWADDLLAGETRDPAAVLRAGSMESAEAKGAVVVRDIAVTTMCPHHLLPAQGHATVAYLPGSRLAGLGTIAEVVDSYARRLTFQEVIGQRIVTLLCDELGARGAFCQLVLTHGCLALRGARQHGARVETLATAGCFAEDQPGHAMALALLRGG